MERKKTIRIITAIVMVVIMAVWLMMYAIP